VDAQLLLVEVDVCDPEVGRLARSKARGVHELEERAVSKCQRTRSFEAGEQIVRIADRRSPR
jgi:hypothetical protein